MFLIKEQFFKILEGPKVKNIGFLRHEECFSKVLEDPDSSSLDHRR